MSREGKPYTTKEDLIVAHRTTAEAARLLGRPERSIIRRRSMLKLNSSGRARMVARRKAYAQAMYNTGKRHFEPVQRTEPALAALDDRDRRSQLPRSLNMLVFGDPLPGMSALDKRKVLHA